MSARAILAIFLIFLVAPLSVAQAAPDPDPFPTQTPTDSEKIPTAPSAPPALFNRAPPQTFQCQRSYTFEGKNYSCDSNLRSDGEKLRPLLEQTPDAVAQLDEYQRSQQALKTTAYVGTAGLILLIAGAVSGSPNGFVRGSMLIGGLIIMEESFRYGYLERERNEAMLGNAVQTYNKANPDKTIQLKFSTGVNF
jgi:hypothetical protein